MSKQFLKFIWLAIFLVFPFIFALALKAIYLYVPGEEVGKISDWISFSGGYLGAFITLGGVYYQMKKEDFDKEYDQKKGLLEYTNFIIQSNHNFNLIETDLYFFQLITNENLFYLKDERKIYNFSAEFVDRNIERFFLLNSGYKILSFYESFEAFISIRNRLINIHNDENLKKLKLFLFNERTKVDSNYGYDFCDRILSKLKLLVNINKLINLLVLKFDKKLLTMSQDRSIDEIKTILMILEIENKIDFEVIDNICLKTNISCSEDELQKKIDTIPKEVKYSLLRELSTFSTNLTFDIGTSSFYNNSLFSDILIGLEDKKFIINNIQKISKEFMDLEKDIKKELQSLKR